MTTMDHLDPFETHTSLPDQDNDPERITAGRYRLPDLTIHSVAGKRTLSTSMTSRKGGWQRVTTMVKAIADARMLDLWHQRMLIVGMVVREDLYDLACATLSGRDLRTTDPKERDQLRRDLEDLASRILLAAGADVGANLGTAFHGFAEAQDLGMMHYARKRWAGRLTNYANGLDAHELRIVPEWTERRVVILRYGLAGTLDRILDDRYVSGVYRIGDLKSQKRFWTWLEISAQLAAYQMADAMWDRASMSYVEMPEVADDYAVVAWSPEEHPTEVSGVDFFDVDLEKGREILELSHTVDRLRAEVRSKNQTVGLLRPLPEMSIVESYARRLDSVSSRAEGSALWAEITSRGLADTPELVALAQEMAKGFDAMEEAERYGR